jgi:F420-non-reducing hydrogenase iron-sulfur subunit
LTTTTEHARRRVAGPEQPRYEPRIVGFLCNWCSYAGADKAGAAEIRYPPNMIPIRVMCSGRVDPQFVLSAFAEGADGVMILACHAGDCHYKEQNYRAVARHRLILRLLTAHGIDPRRCHFGFISAAEAQEFADTVAEMTRILRELGPPGGARTQDG